MKTNLIFLAAVALAVALGPKGLTQILSGQIIYSFEEDLWQRDITGVDVADLPLASAGTSPDDVNLTNSSGDERWPRLSPSGDKLAFTLIGGRGKGKKASPGGLRIYDLVAGPALANQVAINSSKGGFASWSANGMWVAYEGDNGIEAVRPDGSIGPVALGIGGRFPVWDPVVGTGGETRIAFQADSEIQMIGVTITPSSIMPTSLPVTIPGVPGGVVQHWQPGVITYQTGSATPSLPADIYCVDPHDVHLAGYLVTNPEADFDPHWGPNLNFIAFTGGGGCKDYEGSGLAIMDLSNKMQYCLIPGVRRFTWGNIAASTPPAPTCTDNDNDGWCVEDGDCDDTNPAIFPGANDTKGKKGHDGVDNDCNGIIDG